ncbi:MAG: hypothetical protein H0T89_34460, partial [Deltaproteobacteria bacterium]|nr:hypothetical protein [Deltaproteobacteria bacterium]
IHLVHGASVLRFRATPGECTLEPAGEPIALPPETPRPQRIDGGPLYMRSGGPAWELHATGDALYAFDFLGGLYRIARGKPEPACTSEFGFRSFAQVGKRWLATRKGIEELELGRAGKCKARSARLDDKARGTIHAIGGALYLASHDKLHRYAGKTATALGAGTRMCALTAMTACGDGACALDHNCPQLIQLAADGAVIRTIEASKLFDVRPYSLDDLASAPDGTVYLLAHHRDKLDGREVCEAAVYAISSAVFAR